MGINSVCDTIQLDSGRQLVLGFGEKRLRMCTVPMTCVHKNYSFYNFTATAKNVIDSWLFWSEMTWSTKLILTFLYFWELFIETLWREVYRTRHYRFLHMQFGCSKGFHVYQFDPGVRRQKASSSSAQWGGGQSSQRIDRTLILRYSHFSATFAILPRWTLKSEWQTNLILRFVCIQQPSYSLLKSHHIYLPIGHQYLPNERAIHQGLVNYKTHFFSRGC